MTRDTNGYSFSDCSSEIGNLIPNMLVVNTNGGYTGDVPVLVISGQTEGFAVDGNMMLTTAGNSSYPSQQESFILHVGKNTEEVTDAFPNATITSANSLENTAQHNYHEVYKETDGTALSTLEGQKITFALGSPLDGNQYILDDIDFDNAYIEIADINVTNAYHTATEPSVIIGSLAHATTQTITLPDADYPMGYLGITVVLPRFSSDTPYKLVYADEVFIDKTEPTEIESVLLCSENPQIFRSSGDSNYHYYYEFTGKIKTEAEQGNLFTIPLTTDRDGDPTFYYADFSLQVTGLELEEDEIWSSASPMTHVGESYIKAENLTTGDVKYTYIGNKEQAWGADASSRGDIDLECLIFDDSSTLSIDTTQDNIIAFTRCYSNGKTSSTVYYTVKFETGFSAVPTIDGEGPEKTYTTINEDDVIRFVPADGIDTSDWDAYIWSYSSYKAEDVIPMTRDADGSWYCDASMVTDQMVQYDLFAVNKRGGVYRYDGLFRTEIDKTAPAIAASSPSYSDGYFDYCKFTVTDNSIRSMIDRPLELSLSWNDAYCDELGLEHGSSIWSTNMDFGDDKTNDYLWNLDEDTQTVDGLTGVRISSPMTFGNVNHDHFELFVSGYLLPETSGVPIQLILTVTDGHGNTATGTMDFGTPDVPKAHLISQELEDDYNTCDEHQTFEFNIPVQPAESWAKRNIEGYDSLWRDAFPITKNGTYDLEYTDIFGRQYTESVDITCYIKYVDDDPAKGVQHDYGFDLYISTLDETGDSVTIVATADDETDFFVTAKMEGNLIHYSSLLNGDMNPLEWESSKTRIADDDGCYVIMRNYEDNGGACDENQRWAMSDHTFIYLNNIAKAAPAANLRFYVDEYGGSYSANELTALGGFTTESYVQVSYTTGRHVTPTNGTTSEHIFRYGEASSCTFSYEDDFGHTATVTVSLSDYGITLTPPPVPYEDHDAPVVGVDVYIKRGGALSKSEYFDPETAAADMAQKFDDLQYVQGYSFTLKVDDYSKYKVVVKTAEPASMTYAGAVSDTIAGVTAAGNTVKVENTIAGDFWVCVVDNASADSASTTDNFTKFKISKADLIDWFDNVAPQASTSETATSMYERRIFIAIDDVDDAGQPTTEGLSASAAQIMENTGSNKTSYPYYIDFTSNSTVPFIIRDMAGNQVTITTSVTSIDDSKPVLSVSWSPCYVEVVDGVTKLDTTKPTAVPVNTDVTAHIYSDKPIDVDKVAAYYYTGTWNPQGQDADISWDATEQVVTVHYHTSNRDRIKVTVFAPNGKSEDIELNLSNGLIDKVLVAGSVQDTGYYKDDQAFNPYAIDRVFTFDEPVYCLQDMKTDENGDVITATQFTVNIADNDAHPITFVDRAGNVLDMSVPMNSCHFDFDAPEITIVDPADGDTSSMNVTTTATITVRITDNAELTRLSQVGDRTAFSIDLSGPETYDSAKGTYSQDWVVTFTHNGTYRMRAMDTTGNVSYLTVTINNVDRILPQIEVNNTTVKMLQGTSPMDAVTLLTNNFTATDNSATATSTGISNKYANVSAINFNVPGTYLVTYCAIDLAGNVAEAKGYVKILDKNAPQVTIDGELAEDDGLLVTSGTAHTISVSNLAEAGEPYKVYIYKGQMTGAQMKYFRGSSIKVADDGSFPAIPGMYTVYIVTQSRRTFLTLLYVEQ